MIKKMMLTALGGEKVEFTIYENLDLTEKTFQAVDLTNTMFINCDLTGVNFSVAKLSNIRFRACRLVDANFDYAILDNISLWQTNVAGATFVDAKLLDLHGFLVDFSQVDFLTADVKNAFIWIGKFTGAKANPEAGFRTTKGGGTPRYKIPVCGVDTPCDPDCRQDCSKNTTGLRNTCTKI